MWTSRGTSSAERKETAKETTQRREGGRQKHHRRVHQDSKTRFHLCAGLPHRESCKLSAGSQPSSLQLTAVSGSTNYQFWGWCPLKFEKNRTGAAAHRANYHFDIPPSIHHLFTTFRAETTKRRAWTADSSVPVMIPAIRKRKRVEFEVLVPEARQCEHFVPSHCLRSNAKF